MRPFSDEAFYARFWGILRAVMRTYLSMIPTPTTTAEGRKLKPIYKIRTVIIVTPKEIAIFYEGLPRPPARAIKLVLVWQLLVRTPKTFYKVNFN